MLANGIPLGYLAVKADRTGWPGEGLAMATDSEYETVADEIDRLWKQVHRGVWDVPDDRLDEVRLRVASMRTVADVHAVRRWLIEQGF